MGTGKHSLAQGIILNVQKKITVKFAQGKIENAADTFQKLVSDSAHNFIINTVSDLFGDAESGLRGFVKGALGIMSSIGDAIKKINFIEQAKDTALEWTGAQLMTNLGINLVETMSNFAGAILDNLPDEPLQPENSAHRDKLVNAFIEGEKIITPLADAISGLLEPGGLTRFVYIMYNSNLNAENYIVIGQPGANNAIKWLKDNLVKGFSGASMVIAAVLDPIIAIGKEIPGLLKSALLNLGSSVLHALSAIPNILKDIYGIFKGQLPTNYISGIQGIFVGIKNLGVDIWNAMQNVYAVIKIASLRTADIFLTGSWVGNKIMDWLVPYESYFMAKQNVRFKIYDYLNKNLVRDDSFWRITHTLNVPNNQGKRTLQIPIEHWGNLKYSDWAFEYFKDLTGQIKNDHPELASYIDEWGDLMKRQKEEAKLNAKAARFNVLKNFKRVESDI